MRPRRLDVRRMLVPVLALLLVLGPSGVAVAQTNPAVAVNEKDGTSIFEFAFDVVKVTEEVVTPVNAAIAYSSCESCQTVAVAIQIVLVMSNPDVVAPQNVSLAVNYECTLCETFAVAYQFVVGIGGEPIELTKEGKKRLKEIEKTIKELLKSDLEIEAILAEIDLLMDEVKHILATQLVPATKDDDDEEEEEEEQETDESPEPETSPSTTPSPSSSPSEQETTPSPEATESP